MPTIEEILDLLVANLTKVEKCEDYMKKEYSNTFRAWEHVEIEK